MQCDKCGSDNTQRLEVVYQQGTSSINTTSYGAGGSLGGLFGVGGGAATTSGTQQTAMGQKAAPPARKKYRYAAIGLFLGLSFMENSILLGGAAAAIAGYFLYKAYQFNNTEWPELYKYWQDSWLCNKCGNIYHQQ